MRDLLLQNIESSALKLYEKLEMFDVNSKLHDSYPKTYLKHLLKHKRYYLEIYRFVFTSIFSKTQYLPSEMVFVDYGSGNGLMAMFASLIGFHKVVAIDADFAFTKAAKITAKEINIDDIEFVHGTEEKLKEINIKDKFVAIAGTDVIEHIYDLEVFFSILSQLPTLEVTVFTTASNPKNIRLAKRLKQFHIKEELYGSDDHDRPLFGDKHPSFLSIRENIIKTYKASLKAEEVELLAHLTRGLRKDDILKVVNHYVDSGVLPSLINHPTNTCDPETGSWCERLMELNEFEDLYTKYGFDLDISNGFYDEYKYSFAVRVAIRILNICIHKFSSFGILVAPFVLLSGRKYDQH